MPARLPLERKIRNGRGLGRDLKPRDSGGRPIVVREYAPDPAHSIAAHDDLWRLALEGNPHACADFLGRYPKPGEVLILRRDDVDTEVRF